MCPPGKPSIASLETPAQRETGEQVQLQTSRSKQGYSHLNLALATAPARIAPSLFFVFPRSLGRPWILKASFTDAETQKVCRKLPHHHWDSPLRRVAVTARAVLNRSHVHRSGFELDRNQKKKKKQGGPLTASSRQHSSISPPPSWK